MTRGKTMSLDVLADVNWLAVLLATLAWFVLGALWYIPPVMGARWQKAGGIATPESGPNPMIFVLTLVAYFVAATVTAMLAVATGSDSAGQGALLGFVVGIGYALTAAGVTALYDKKPDPFGWFWINGLLNLVGLTVVGLVIGAFGF